MIIGKPSVVARRAEVARVAREQQIGLDAAALLLLGGSAAGVPERCRRSWLQTWPELERARAAAVGAFDGITLWAIRCLPPPPSGRRRPTRCGCSGIQIEDREAGIVAPLAFRW